MIALLLTVLTAPGADKPAPRPNVVLFATIARVDQNLGRLRRLLRDQRLGDNTILVFLTDNGTAGGARVHNAGMRGQKGSQYDGGHRVPCFLHWPAGGLDKPRDVRRLAAHIDLLPTLVDLCGLSLPRPVAMDGASLRPLLQNPQAPWPDRTLVLGTPRNQIATAAPPRPWERSAVMTDRWRLVNRDELYDMPADPGQERNVADAHPEVVRRLRAACDRYWSDVSRADKDWQGRPVLGGQAQEELRLASEAWTPRQGNCPWSQGSVAVGAVAFGFWPVRVARGAAYFVYARPA